MHQERVRVAEQLQAARRHLQDAETAARQPAARGGATGEREKAEALSECSSVFGEQYSRPDLGLTPNLAALESLLRLKVRHMEEEIDAANRLGWSRGKANAAAKREAFAFALGLLEDLKPHPRTRGNNAHSLRR
jgi:hypothetical protein